jgi:hypothetical protein
MNFKSDPNIEGAKGLVFAPECARLADSCVPKKLRKCHLFLPIPTHAYPRHGPWAIFYTGKICRGAKRVRDHLISSGQLRETTPTEKHRSSRITGGLAWG